MIRVLLVEDDAMIRKMTRIFLESQKRFEGCVQPPARKHWPTQKTPLT